MIVEKEICVYRLVLSFRCKFYTPLLLFTEKSYLKTTISIRTEFNGALMLALDTKGKAGRSKVSIRISANRHADQFGSF